MAILQQFGINETFFYQLVIFLIAITSLSLLVFKPYLAALEQRENRTKGGEELAHELHRASADLRAQYETRAREVSGQIKSIYDDYRSQASKEQEHIVSRARGESQKLVDMTTVRSELESSTMRMVLAMVGWLPQKKVVSLLAAAGAGGALLPRAQRCSSVV